MLVIPIKFEATFNFGVSNMNEAVCINFNQIFGINSNAVFMISKLLHSLNKKILNRTELFGVLNGIENCRQKIGCMSGWLNNQFDSSMLQIYPLNLQSTGRRSAFSKWRISQSLFSRPLYGGLEMIKT
ncbi:MAG: hypothetical protein OEY49_16710 [Candidatus Heimdallarchaeota archaeon]|nr:hypothetical protein [Candidatus Heimdallarchaeota archaeon]